MIAYFDTSAMLAVLLQEHRVDVTVSLWDRADRVLSSRITYAEGRAGLVAAHRLGRLSHPLFRAAKDLFEERFRQLQQVEPTQSLCRLAGDLAETHQLKGYDAVHLATAMQTAGEETVFASRDLRLRRAAAAEGFRTVP